ncbi:MAG TPA: DUF2155 domain-containing protein [Rickettsiales bacterium]|nr:DUF2155 domain-containing protein [Rickettsiales bacterium]
MYRCFFLLAALLMLAAPVHAQTAPASNPAPNYEDVEEPDQADESMPAEHEPGKGTKAKEPVSTPASPAPATPPLTGFQPGYNTVLLLGLNKVTGHAQRIEAKIGEPVTFDALTITLHSCWQSAPEDHPDNAALLEIYEKRPQEAPERVFLGWMFSASPSISSLENPFYDITVFACKKTESKK